MKKIFSLLMIAFSLILVAACDFEIGGGNNNNNEDSEPYLNYTSYQDVYVGEVLPLNIKSSSEFSVTSNNEDVAEYLDDYLNIKSEGYAKITIKNEDLEESFSINAINPFILKDGDCIKYYQDDVVDLENYFDTNLECLYFANVQNEEENIITIDDKTLYVENVTKNQYIKDAIKVAFAIRSLYIEATIDLFIIQDTNLFEIENVINEMNVCFEHELSVYTFFEDDVLTYTSSNEDVIIFEGSTMKAIAKGTSTITVYSEKLNESLSFDISVSEKQEYPADTKRNVGVYLGLNNYGTAAGSNIDNFKFKFSIDGETKLLTLTKVGNYELHNLLEEGKLYELTINNSNITNLTKLDDEIPFSTPKKSSIVEGLIEEVDNYQVKVNGIVYNLIENPTYGDIQKAAGGALCASYTPKVGDNVLIVLTKNNNCQGIFKEKAIKEYTLPIEGEAGVRTLTNFFKTALSAVGHALYIYGGDWDYQDVGSANQARTIGVAESWIEFFYEQNASYSYKNESNKSKTYYPFGAFNEYYYAGVDCSGYVGWVVYNIMNTASGNEGYVMSSTKMANNFASRGWGTFQKSIATPTSGTSDLKVGDVVSISGHVWICLGVCSDGSIVILHSTPSQSKNGTSGGGAQLGAIGNSTNCEAYRLADQYNKTYYPDWSERYNTSLKDYSTYLNTSKTNAGKFSWYLNENGLTDPDGLSTKTPAEILAFLFNE